MNKDKSIKDLKKRNDQLAYQYRMRDIRCITLERRTEKYEQQIDQLTNNWRLLEEVIKDMLFTTPHESQMLDFILDKMQEMEEGKR